MDIEAMFSTFPTLTTNRLLLRQIQPNDAEALFATFSDESVMEFYGHLPHRSIEESVELIRKQHVWYAERTGIRWGITLKGDDRVIGSCGFYGFDEGFRRAETGYELNRAFWRQSIMSEAMSAILNYAFSEPALNRVEAVVDDVNERSKGLLRKLGFTHEGTLRRRFFFRNRFLDEHYFGLLKEEWPL
ncbi:GNAT family N-acetyltransferase [Reticulibacter mediterranei]|uniref:GNAT family N-acetyltransferase n=1 Tax=Reticulibacter mediterranei TaxID=2778369 RepID=A0A8J3IV54_9CHLR|nr:GNAT family N-acetyltransferase [Reticulibacter mediterranei]GHO98434.1 GNAT family N-acetyltransferase [Reticulibacter mediterranei]